jgi:hypothetical protein
VLKKLKMNSILVGLHTGTLSLEETLVLLSLMKQRALYFSTWKIKQLCYSRLGSYINWSVYYSPSLRIYST